MAIRVISASAGTGKTHSLIDYVFQLEYDERQRKVVPRACLQQACERLQQTLFLSFSNAAVDELKRRIYRKLNEIAGNAGIGYGHLASIHVSTIHSFCLDMVRLFRFELGLSDDVDFEDDDGRLWSSLVQEFFREEWNASGLHDLLNGFHYVILPDNMRQNTIDKLLKVTDEDALRKSIERRGEQLYYLLEFGARINPPAGGQQNAHDANNRLNAALENCPDSLELNDDGKLNDPKHAQPLADFAQAVSPVLEAIVKKLGDRYMQRMHEDGRFTFDAIVFIFIKRIVRNDPARFVQRLHDAGMGYTRFCFDEAQDNDICQNMLISMLHNVGNIEVVVVGDLKQSIYGFRNAVPCVLRDMIANLENVEVLRHTYRIRNNALLQWINSTCNRLAGQQQQQQGLRWRHYNNQWDALELPDQNPPPERQEPPVVLLHRTPQQGHNVRFADGFDPLALAVEGSIGVLADKRGNLRKAEFLTRLKNAAAQRQLPLNVRCEEAVKDMKGADTIMPEVNVLTVLDDWLSHDRKATLPLVLLFTEPGKVVYESIAGDRANDVVGEVRRLFFRRLDTAGAVAGRAERVFEYLARHQNIWRALWHAGIDEVLYGDVDNVTRALNHLLYALYLEERNDRPHFPESGKWRKPWDELCVPPRFSYPSGESGSGCEVNTIHSAKGLEYDTVFVAMDLTETLTDPGHRNAAWHRHSHAYMDMYSVGVAGFLQRNPSLRITWIPLYGGVVYKTARDDGNAPQVWRSAHDDVQAAIRDEEFNKFYVAITRAKRKVVLFDTARQGEGQGFLAEMQHQDDCFDEVPRNNADNDGAALYALKQPLEPNVNLPPTTVTMQMRDYTRDREEPRRHQGVPYPDRLKRVSDGRNIHRAIQMSLAGDAEMADFFAGKSERVQRVYQQEQEWIRQIRNQHAGWVQELPLWNTDDGGQRRRNLKGSVDLIGLPQPVGGQQAGTVRIYEMKVVFDEAHREAQEREAAQQLERYQQALSAAAENGIEVQSETKLIDAYDHPDRR